MRKITKTNDAPTVLGTPGENIIQTIILEFDSTGVNIIRRTDYMTHKDGHIEVSITEYEQRID